MSRDQTIYLRDILDAIDSIESFVTGMDFAAFQQDDKTYSAVVRKLEVIGEATKQVPDEIRQRKPEIPWKEMAGMRDRLIHAYFAIDVKLVWRTIHDYLPTTRSQISEILQNLK